MKQNDFDRNLLFPPSRAVPVKPLKKQTFHTILIFAAILIIKAQKNLVVKRYFIKINWLDWSDPIVYKDQANTAKFFTRLYELTGQTQVEISY